MPKPGGMERRKSSHSQPHYQTFSTPPPKSRGKPPTPSSDSSTHYRPLTSTGNKSQSSPNANGNGNGNSYGSSQDAPDGENADEDEEGQHSSPLPKKQLAILAIIALAEQTALNSISPYLPEMAASFPEVNPRQIGLYVGTIASTFALAQFVTNFFWGYLSDRIGRKPVVMLGTILTAACFVGFGLSRTLWQAILAQTLMGLVNGNQGVISTCLGEITDRSNQSKAFLYLPVIYGLGGITGPAVGGLLVLPDNPFNPGQPNPYPYLLPNLFSAAVLLLDFILTGFFLEESLDQVKDLPPIHKRIGSMFSWLWQFAGHATRPTYLRHGHHRHSSVSTDDDEDNGTDGGSSVKSLLSMPDLFPSTNNTALASKDVLNRDTIILLSTYLIFQLSNISFNTLYPIFASAPTPTGRNLSPELIGLSLSFAGIVTIVFQVGIFGKLKEKMGNRVTYRAGLAGFAIAMFLMPFIGYKNSPPLFGIGNAKVWLWIELGFVLLIKTVASVGGLTSALLLITNSARTPSVLGTLNGLAQTLSAGGRAIGPFLSGGLFTLATDVRPKGEAVAWGVFGGIALIGFIASFGIRGEALESGEWSDEEEGEEGDEEDEE